MGRSPYGFDVFGFSATTEIDREDWGLTYNMALETGGVMIGKKVKIEIEGEGHPPGLIRSRSATRGAVRSRDCASWRLDAPLAVGRIGVVRWTERVRVLTLRVASRATTARREGPMGKDLSVASFSVRTAPTTGRRSAAAWTCWP